MSFVPFTGSPGEMAQSQLQWSVHSMDPCQSATSLCRVGSQVRYLHWNDPVWKTSILMQVVSTRLHLKRSFLGAQNEICWELSCRHCWFNALKNGRRVFGAHAIWRSDLTRAHSLPPTPPPHTHKHTKQLTSHCPCTNIPPLLMHDPSHPTYTTAANELSFVAKHNFVTLGCMWRILLRQTAHWSRDLMLDDMDRFCVFRYGLPVNFQAMILRPQKKTIRRLREVLSQLYSHLDNSAFAGAADVSTSRSASENFRSSDFFAN